MQAVKDYEDVYFKKATGVSKRDNNISKMKADCTKFFNSTWFTTLTGINPVYLLEKIKKEMGALEKDVDTLIFTDEGNQTLKKRLAEKEEEKDTREKGVNKYFMCTCHTSDHSMMSIVFPAKMSDAEPVEVFDTLARKINQNDNTNPYRMFDILYPGSVPILDRCFRITKEDYEKFVTKSQREVRGSINDRIVGYYISNTYKI